MAASPKKAKSKPTSGGESVELSPGSVRAIAEAVADKLVEVGPKLARLAAADTVHTVEKPETVLRRAIDEGEIASVMMAADPDGA
jgi:hypothetical protein